MIATAATADCRHRRPPHTPALTIEHNQNCQRSKSPLFVQQMFMQMQDFAPMLGILDFYLPAQHSRHPPKCFITPLVRAPLWPLKPAGTRDDLRNSILGLQHGALITRDGDQIIIPSDLDVRTRLDPESGDGGSL